MGTFLLAVGLSVAITQVIMWPIWLISDYLKRPIRLQRKRQKAQWANHHRWEKVSAGLPDTDLVWLQEQRRLSGWMG